MNKQQARQEALKILLAMIDQEIGSPTGFTDDTYGAIPNPENWDMELVHDALDDISDQLQSKLKKLRS